MTFTLSNGDSVVQGSTGTGYATADFVGVTDSTAFTSVLITAPDFGLNINNIAFAVPEPSSFCLGVTGVIGLLGYAWRYRRAIRS